MYSKKNKDRELQNMSIEELRSLKDNLSKKKMQKGGRTTPKYSKQQLQSMSVRELQQINDNLGGGITSATPLPPKKKRPDYEEMIMGCTSSQACNYNDFALIDDGSCEYVSCAIQPRNVSHTTEAYNPLQIFNIYSSSIPSLIDSVYGVRFFSRSVGFIKNHIGLFFQPKLP